MTAQTLLIQARSIRHLTQAALALAARTPQPSIARVEGGQRDLNVQTLDRLAHAAGCQLAILPSTRTTAAGAALAVRQAIGNHDDEAAYRSVIQLADDLASEESAERVALCVTPPPATGDERYDAFIAGIVEHRLSENELPLPRWVPTAPYLSAPWFVDEWGGDDAVAATPEALRLRGVIIGDYELASR
jgi:transcriptional regulator with XRE-family HTH domain